MKVNERIAQLREKMKKRNLDAYIVPTSDPHQSEYICDRYKTREFLTGFTGSAGTVVVTMSEAILWTDSRYFIQAERQLAGSEVILFKMGESGVPALVDYLDQKLPEYGKVGLDGTCFARSIYKELSEKLKTRLFVTNIDYANDIWENRPARPDGEAFVLDMKYAGVSAREKIAKLRNAMEEKDVDGVFIGASEDICYLYNIRGNDVEYTPVLLSYAFVTFEKAYLCADLEKLSDEVKEHLARNGITVGVYDYIYEIMKGLKPKTTVYLDPQRTNVSIYNEIPSNVRVVTGTNITSTMKAVKNETELANLREAYLKDGVALVKFFNWVETGAHTGNLTEAIASDKLESFRAEDEDFIEPSFQSIVAYKENASMPHYAPVKEKSKTISSEGLLLVDSGGQYYQGTTDITRTVALGELSTDEIFHYTMTLKSHISLMNSRFLKGTTGSYLDAFARLPLWKAGLNFMHGTGHGVGYLLSVHEGPFSISGNDAGVPLEPGMVHSVEPGVYIEGSHGVRIENVVAVIEDEKNEFGEFYSLESLSIVPIDTRPIDTEYLEQWEVDWLNDYNQKCFDVLSPFLESIDLEYLERVTLAI